MGLDRVNSGRAVPDDFNVVIEIPMNADPVKYEVDKESGAIFVDRVLTTPMRYPCNYGYVPHTLCGDGDPVDVLVLMPLPLIPGAVIRCRPVAMLQMTDEAGACLAPGGPSIRNPRPQVAMRSTEPRVSMYRPALGVELALT